MSRSILRFCMDGIIYEATRNEGGIQITAPKDLTEERVNAAKEHAERSFADFDERFAAAMDSLTLGQRLQ